MANIKHHFIIKAPVNKVYNAITEQAGLSSWWTTNTIAKPEVGFVNEFLFGADFHNKMKITRLEADKLVCWDCIGGDSEWIGTKLSFELNGKSGNTEIMFIQSGWAAETLFHADCNYNWGQFMKSLKDLCETGTGNPYGAKE